MKSKSKKSKSFSDVQTEFYKNCGAKTFNGTSDLYISGVEQENQPFINKDFPIEYAEEPKRITKARCVLKISDDFNLENLAYYGFRKQDYLIEYGRKEKTGCNVWRYDDDNEYYGLTIFEKTPKSGYYAPDYEWDDSCAEPRVVYMMDDDCSFMESTKFKLNPVLYGLIKDGVVISEIIVSEVSDEE